MYNIIIIVDAHVRNKLDGLSLFILISYPILIHCIVSPGAIVI